MPDLDALRTERREVADKQVALRRARANLAGTKRYADMRKYSTEITKLEARRAELTVLIGDGPK